ncbi:tyrosine--tRNA ligase [Candidatus Saccharibacteria bacterium]|nr:tyrosine--tRNA ligase [Candidatus Saccharibacteria bacterium]
MKLSEELIWRGFQAETTIKDPSNLDERKSKKFYLGADPSADSLTIGNLAALMMCACFVRHGYKPYLLVGGATGQIGDPKETGERDLKSIEEVEHNKACIKKQMEGIISPDSAANTKDDGDAENDDWEVTMVDNYDWFKDMNYLEFLRTVGKAFSMTQLLDRKFIQSRIGEGGSGISYAEFSYTLIQGYDFWHLYKKYGIDLQLCGADQYGNASTGIHLINKFENAEADVWSTPLIIDPVTGRKFGKSEGNAIWLSSKDNGQGNFTSVFDFYQFWLNQPDESVEYLLKIYTVYDKDEIEKILAEHKTAPEKRLAQKALAKGVTEVVHGKTSANAAITLTEILFGGKKLGVLSETEIENIALLLPTIKLSEDRPQINLVDALVESELVSSKTEARNMIKSNAVSVNGEKITDENFIIMSLSILKRGKNKFALVK